MAKKINVVDADAPDMKPRVGVASKKAAPSASQERMPKTTKVVRTVTQSKPVVNAKYSSKRYANKIKLNSHKIKTNSAKNRYLIYGVCAIASAAFIAIIVVLVLPLFNRPPLDEDFFVSDNTKTVVSLDAGSSNGTTRHTHMVYTYEGDEVTGLKTYFEYPDEESARAAVVTLKDQPEFKGAVVEGNYVVVTADESQFKGLTASDVKQQADAIRQFQASQKPQEEENNQKEQENKEPQDDQNN